MSLYKFLVKPIIFQFDAEKAHHFVISSLDNISKNPAIEKEIERLYSFSHPTLKQELFGLSFASPVGLPAGADKDAKVLNVWQKFSFGFLEVGSVTRNSQPGNPKPRLWRLIPHRSICVNMGLNSEGAEIVKERLAKKENTYPIGTSIAKTTAVPQEDTVKDYLATFKIIAPVSDFITLNVSCPNVQGFTCMQRSEFLKGLLEEVEKTNQEYKKPIFIKIGPDNTDEELKEICDLAIKHNISAIICTNLTKKRDENTEHIPYPGGLSGKLVDKLSDETIHQAYQFLKNSPVKIIGVGGIFNADDAYRKIKLGASLVQLYTGFIFEGPGIIKKINLGLVDRIQKDGFSNISEAVGSSKLKAQS